MAGNYGGKRAGAGRKSFKPTEENRKQVETLIGLGATIDELPVLMAELGLANLTEPTLRKHFPDELANGKTKSKAKMRQRLFKSAMAGNVTAMIFWLKIQDGWTERQRVELTGNGGGPIQNVAMSAEQFNEIARKIADEF